MKDLRSSTKELKSFTPREYLTASVLYSNQKCDAFFDTVTRFRQDSKFLDQVMSAALVAATPLYPIYKVSQASQTLFTQGIGAALTTNASLRDLYVFERHAGSLRSLVKQSQSEYLKDEGVRKSIKFASIFSVAAVKTDLGDKLQYVSLPHGYTFVVSDIDNITRDEAFLAARHVAHGYAQQCSLHNLNKLVGDSIGAAKIENTTRGGAPLADPLLTVK